MSAKKETLDLDKIVSIIGYNFKDRAILERAFIHSSYSHAINSKKNYQQLEFLGDSVLDFVVAKHLIEKFPDYSEGKLTQMRAKIVSEAPLAAATARLNLQNFLLLGNGETKQDIRRLDSVRADILEAVAGAIYLDGKSLDLVEQFVLFALKPEIEEAAQKSVSQRDAKSHLNEYALKHGIKIEYVFNEKTGADHAPVYTYSVLLDGKVRGTGRGAAKAQAQQAAAAEALKDVLSAR